MHLISKNNRCQAGWFQLQQKGKYMTSLDKPNKVYNWKNDFFLVHTEDTSLARILSSWTSHQNIFKENELGARTPLIVQQLEYFETVEYQFRALSRRPTVPKNWLPTLECFYNKDFLRAFDLAGGRRITRDQRGRPLTS